MLAAKGCFLGGGFHGANWVPSSGELSEEVVSIAYDRFADHIISDYLLNTHLDADDPEIAFSKDGGLAFLGEEEQYVRYGLIEALCIQVPERTGKELVKLAPRRNESTQHRLCLPAKHHVAQA